MGGRHSLASHLLLIAWFTVIKGMRPAMVDNIPYFTSEPDSRVFIQNNRSFLVSCEAVGEPPPVQSWRNESALNSHVVINATRSGLWFVHGVQHSGIQRVGIFRCIASNTAGVVMSKKFELSFVYLRNIVVQISGPVTLNNVVRLKCNVDTNQAVSYTWFKNNIALNASTDARLGFLPSGVLQIRGYRVSDNGVYSCRAENDYKVITSRGVRLVGQSPSKTRIHVYPGKIIHTMVGNPLVMECIQNSPQNSTVAWSKVTELGTRTLVNGTGSANLVFDFVKVQDAGEYRCRATNGGKKTVLVSVGVPPSFPRKLPATTEVTQGEQVVLKCKIKGDPAPSVTWYKDGEAIAEDPRTRFYRNKFEHALVLSSVAIEDIGVYQCEIENKYGSSIDQTHLVVIDKMEPPYRVKGHVLSTTVVNVTWEIPPGYKAPYFIVNCVDVVRYSIFQEITLVNASYRVVNSLRPFTEYEISVVLYANHRQSGRSSAFLVRTFGKEPSGPPSVVKLASYSAGTLDVTWLPPFLVDRNGQIISYEIKYFIEGDNVEYNVTITKDFYTKILAGLQEGKKYVVKVAARTKKGLGPFSNDVVCVISESSAAAVLPAPTLIVKSINASIMVIVMSPANADIEGYQLTYKFIVDHFGRETKVIKNETSFFYKLEDTALNVEYVVIVVPFGPGTSRGGRPAIAVGRAKGYPLMMQPSMFRLNRTKFSPLQLSCESAINYTALHVTWKKISDLTDYIPLFKVEYFTFGERRKVKTIVTKYFNVTIDDVLAGNTYEVRVETTVSHNAEMSYSSSRMLESKYCHVSERKPETPPSRIMCNTSKSNIVVTWQAPTKSNGRILRYHIMWLGPRNEMVNREYQPTQFLGIEHEEFMFPATFAKRDENFTVFVNAENSVGLSPMGNCIINTKEIDLHNIIGGSDHERSNDDADIEKGIVIGCIVSVLLLFILVMFVCWSGCRRRKPLQANRGNTTPYSNSRIRSQQPDTVSTEVSEISATKYHHILQKFLDEETSKESDRGVGMTPKSSRLYLASEKVPFLPRAVNQSGSVDTSCDSQDSGVQGYGKKVSPTPGALKDRDKIPLNAAEGSVVETVF